ncbi:MAG: response regulator [Acidobacteria bacterium]|nr:response regulator [Acidobacteriota bacterium]
MLVKTFLRGSTFSCICAADAFQATSIAVSEKPRVILLDIGLPGGNGLQLLERLRANTHTQAIPIIIATGQITPGLEAKVRAKGATAYLQKPIDKQILLATLQQVLQESPHATTPHS